MCTVAPLEEWPYSLIVIVAVGPASLTEDAGCEKASVGVVMPAAPNASTSPAPTTSLVPPFVTAPAVAFNLASTWDGARPGSSSSISAATAAAWGAASEVPQKR